MISERGLTLLKELEGLRLVAYQDSVGVWTLGYGTTVYPSGIKVKKGDRCTIQQATEYLRNDVEWAENTVDKVIKSNINQNQYDALVCLTYNIGATAFTRSTLAKVINKNPNDPIVKDRFEDWKRAGTNKDILLPRRKKEYNFYKS